MARFRKTVLRPTDYHPRNDFTGTRQKETFTKDRIAHLANRMQEMLDAGLNIACPFKHDGSIPLADKGKGSKDNAGFWDSPLLGLDGSLVAEVDVPVQADAERFGKTIKEVSPWIVKDWTDGNGRLWPGESILHSAAVIHPVDRNQDNFKPLDQKTSPFSVALSDFDLELGESEGQSNTAMDKGDRKIPNEEKKEETPPEEEKQEQTGYTSNCSIEDALQCLGTLGLTLPKDTTPENLIERICIAGNAVAAAQREGVADDANGSENNRTVEQPSPIAMSEGSALEGVSMSDQTLPADHPVMKQLRTQLRGSYQKRINSLIQSGRVSTDYAKKWLQPYLEDSGFQILLSDEGEPQPTELDARLEALEAMPAYAGMNGARVTVNKGKASVKGFPISLAEEENPWDDPTAREPQSTEEIDAQLDKQFENTGRTDLVRKGQRVVAD